MSYAYPLPSSSSNSAPSAQKIRHSSLSSHDPKELPSATARPVPPPISTASPSSNFTESFPDLSSSTVPPPTQPPPSPLSNPGAWFSYPLSYAATSLYRRVSVPPDPRLTGLLQAPGASRPRYPSPGPASTMMIFSRSRSRQRQAKSSSHGQGSTGLVQPPSRKPSPFQPPPLAPLQLTGFRLNTSDKDRVLSKALAEEIRLLVPPRLQLETEWQLCYSVEQDGASLATLYSKCEGVGEGHARAGFVLVVRDAVGGIFGAFLTDAPRPSNSYYGTGECFLWSATIQTFEKMLAHLPPPPSEDTTHMESRSTTILSPTRSSFSEALPVTGTNDAPGAGQSQSRRTSNPELNVPLEEEERIRFRAFPYSGVNDYMIYCENGYMSVGGGDGKYGLWLDDRLEQGVSSPSLTFGNEGLSEEGEKFDVLGVEIWFVGG